MPFSFGNLYQYLYQCQHSKKGFQPLLLPVLTFTFFGNKKNRTGQCLLDTCSQRSYLREDAVLSLRGEAGMSPVTYDITTFLGSSTRHLKEAHLIVGIPGGNKLPISFLVDPHFNHHFSVSIEYCMGQFTLWVPD